MTNSISFTFLHRDLLQSKDFQDAIKTIQEEPIPYFGMLTSEGSNDMERSADEKELSEEVNQHSIKGDMAPTEEVVLETVSHEGKVEKDDGIDPDKEEIATDIELVSV